MQVRDVMTQATVTESRHDSLRSAAERMWRQQTGSLIITEGGQLDGHHHRTGRAPRSRPRRRPGQDSVDDAMTAEVYTVPPDMQLQDAAREMAARWIRHLPVVEDGKLLGVVSMRDVTGVFAAMAAGNVRVEHEFDQLVRERRLARIEHGDLD